MRGVCLLSGGLDSGVASALFAAENELLAAVFCDYGQRAAAPERRAACALAGRFGVPLFEVALPWLGALAQQSGARLIAGTGELPQGTVERPGDAASARAVWIPARNVLFVALAAAHAEVLGADCVVAGFNREEAETFPDNSAAFLAAATAALALGTANAVQVVSPTIDLDKPAIVAAASRLGFTAADFWSCYDGGDRPCGACESCLRSRFAR